MARLALDINPKLGFLVHISYNFDLLYCFIIEVSIIHFYCFCITRITRFDFSK